MKSSPKQKNSFAKRTNFLPCPKDKTTLSAVYLGIQLIAVVPKQLFVLHNQNVDFARDQFQHTVQIEMRKFHNITSLLSSSMTSLRLSPTTISIFSN